MTTYGAYDRGLPCKNTSCKSHGKSHPNCRCYPGLAGGGEVSRFCDTNQHHDPSCEYYSEGGAANDPSIVDHSDYVSGHLVNDGLHGILDMADHDQEKAMDIYHKSVKRGHKFLGSEIERMFEGKKTEKIDRSKQEERIEEWIYRGGITKDLQHDLYAQHDEQSFADGGEVEKTKRRILHNHPIETVYPEQNMMLNEVKSRVSNYLSSLRPQDNVPGLAFDSKPDNTEQKKAFKKALKIAAHPTRVLDKAYRGTIEQDDVQHLGAMYPELSNHMVKKITEKIVRLQLEGKKPNYKTRQGLSILLGVPLSSEMLPQNIAAAQATFKMQSAQPQQGGSSQKKTSAIGKAGQAFLTADQAAASRQQKQ